MNVILSWKITALFILFTTCFELTPIKFSPVWGKYLTLSVKIWWLQFSFDISNSEKQLNQGEVLIGDKENIFANTHVPY